MNRAQRDWKPAWRKLRAGIERELRDEPARVVAEFTRSVGVYLGAAKTLAEIRGTFGNEATRLRELQRLRRITEKLAAESARYRSMVARPYSYRVTDMFLAWPTTEPDIGQSFYRAHYRATQAAKALRAEIDTALVSPRRRGPPSADDLGLLARIAARWRELFDERPTSTPGGKFANVATLVLENLHGRPPRDVSRQVRAALKAI